MFLVEQAIHLHQSNTVSAVFTADDGGVTPGIEGLHDGRFEIVRGWKSSRDYLGRLRAVPVIVRADQRSLPIVEFRVPDQRVCLAKEAKVRALAQ